MFAVGYEQTKADSPGIFFASKINVSKGRRLIKMYQPRSAKEIYDLLLDKCTVMIGLQTRQEYHALRMQLFRLHEASKEILEIEDSIVTSYNEKEKYGTFKFGKRKPKFTDFQLLVDGVIKNDSEDEYKQHSNTSSQTQKVPEDLGDDKNKHVRETNCS